MARVRSPNYPAFSLPEAINRIRTIHTAEQHLAAPKEVIARHLGYGGLNGGSLKAISALSKYGLLEEVSGDKVKVSPLAMSILFPSKPEERADAIRDAAYKPTLFSEIQTEWEGAQPSDENLRTWLIRRNFASDALERVIQAYRETMDLVTRESAAYPASDNPSGARQAEKSHMQSSTLQSQSGRQGSPPPPVMTPMSVSFSGDRLEVSAVLMDRESVEKLISALNATKPLLPLKRDEPTANSGAV